MNKLTVTLLALAVLWSPSPARGEPRQSSTVAPQVEKSECGTEADIEPQNAKGPRFIGRDARIFIEAVEPETNAEFLDTVVVFSGADVFGGTVAFAFKNGCAVGRKFLSDLAYTDAVQMVSLFANNDALKQSQNLDVAKLTALAETGNVPAQFHLGLSLKDDRRAAIEWFKRGASAKFGPAMVGLGIALAGPDWFGEIEAHIVGQPFPSDEFTDRALAYYWLNLASDSEEESTSRLAIFKLASLMERMSADEQRRGRKLILDGKSSAGVAIEETGTLYNRSDRGLMIYTAPDVASLQVINKDAAKFGHELVITITGKESGQEIARAEAKFESQQQAFQKRFAELESKGRLFPVHVGTVVRVVHAESDRAKVEILSGSLKGKFVYVNTRDLAR